MLLICQAVGCTAQKGQRKMVMIYVGKLYSNCSLFPCSLLEGRRVCEMEGVPVWELRILALIEIRYVVNTVKMILVMEGCASNRLTNTKTQKWSQN